MIPLELGMNGFQKPNIKLAISCLLISLTQINMPIDQRQIPTQIGIFNSIIFASLGSLNVVEYSARVALKHLGPYFYVLVINDDHI